MNETVGIGILSHNGLEHLRNLMTDIAKLSPQPMEIIVLDNGSNDGSKDFLIKLADAKKIRFIDCENNEGYSKGKNMIVEHATCSYMLLLDDDIRITQKNALTKLMSLQKDINPGFVSVLLVNKGDQDTSYVGGFWSLFGYGQRKKYSLSDLLSRANEYHFCHAPEGGALFFERRHFIDVGEYNLSQPYYSDVGDIGIRSYVLTGRKTISTTHLYFIHEGMGRKVDLQNWLWKFQYIPSGNLKILFYNFRWYRVAWQCWLIAGFYGFGSLYKSMQFRSSRPAATYFKSIYLFFKDLPETMQTRHRIQSARVRGDSFLDITQP